VEGGATVRFCPAYPQILPQFLVRGLLKNSQKTFYALALDPHFALDLGADPDAGLTLLELSEAERHGVLHRIGSTYCIDDHVVRDSLYPSGPRIVTFANILKYDEFSPHPF